MTAAATGSDRVRGAVPPGLPDDLFARGDAPMTKSEVRAVTMSAARLRPRDRVLDVGAGTGSLTVEAALLCPEGHVVAVERDPAALDLLRVNVERFRVGNVTVVAGAAPEAVTGPATASGAALAPSSFDCVLVGGSGGRLEAILDVAAELLRPGGRLVCNTVCLETTAKAAAALRRPPWTAFSCSQVSVARGVSAGPLLRFEALNPVWVTAARRSDHRDPESGGGGR
jgi:cobalt-precorrin-6B (C15)-methyltransferase